MQDGAAKADGGNLTSFPFPSTARAGSFGRLGFVQIRANSWLKFPSRPLRPFGPPYGWLRAGLAVKFLLTTHRSPLTADSRSPVYPATGGAHHANDEPPPLAYIPAL